MTMTTIDSNIIMAIVQFGHKPKEEKIKKLAKLLKKEQIADWYFFEETADKEFEIKALCPHYTIIYECIDAESFEEIK